MSPALDMPLNRREAMASLLTMLAFVMGVGGLPEGVEATEPAYDPTGLDYDIHGIMVGHDKTQSPWLEMGVNVHLGNGAIAISSATTRGEPEPYVIVADHPEARRVVDQIALAMLATGYEVPLAKKKVARAQLAPSTTAEWQSRIMLESADESLPLRTAYLDARLSWSGDHIQLDLTDPHSRAGRGLDFQGTGKSIARFELLGDGAAFLNAMSADADAAWEREERGWMGKPKVHCPVCECQWPERDGCTNCGRTGWVLLTPEEANRSFEYRKAERQALIDTAIAKAGAR